MGACLRIPNPINLSKSHNSANMVHFNQMVWNKSCREIVKLCSFPLGIISLSIGIHWMRNPSRNYWDQMLINSKAIIYFSLHGLFHPVFFLLLPPSQPSLDILCHSKCKDHPASFKKKSVLPSINHVEKNQWEMTWRMRWYLVYRKGVHNENNP